MRWNRHFACRPPLLVAAAAILGLALAGGAVPGPPAHAAGAEVFQDFESDADLTGLTVSLPQVDGAARASYASHGASSLRFTVGPADTPHATGDDLAHDHLPVAAEG